MARGVPSHEGAAAMSLYYVHWNGAAWFVKEGEFFKEQGGLTKPWGKAWRPLRAASIEDARKLAEARAHLDRCTCRSSTCTGRPGCPAVD